MRDDANYELNNFDSLKIELASPDKIRNWSHGEVTKPETASAFSDLRRTGNATAVNTRESVTRASSAISAVLK